MHDPASTLRRIRLLRTSVNRLWALLRTSPLHAVEHLLRLGCELLEAGRSCLLDYGHRLTLNTFHYDEAKLLSLIDTPSCPSAFVDEAKVWTFRTRRLLRSISDEGIDLHALLAPDAYRGRFLGPKEGVRLYPGDHVFWGRSDFQPTRPVRLIDLLGVEKPQPISVVVDVYDVPSVA